eukprot:CAMPEP_0198128862 /NCGR_PEP_ID=MMETSP1442-20131203/50358_1 /TAXON_ID= /ORGANISM="Craspedostauros australis, Strain CCMP3328" /LENGTH=136 /DNA_ID=CAMNT_0043789111 /DNA_START=108 /DNA_END=517 /DNA_ORIENTATION=+
MCLTATLGFRLPTVIIPVTSTHKHKWRRARRQPPSQKKKQQVGFLSSKRPFQPKQTHHNAHRIGRSTATLNRSKAKLSFSGGGKFDHGENDDDDDHGRRSTLSAVTDDPNKPWDGSDSILHSTRDNTEDDNDDGWF